MEDKINLIKEKLTGKYDEDMEYLTAMSNAQNKIVEEALSTIDAINSVMDEITKDENNEVVNEEVEEDKIEEVKEEKTEVNHMIEELISTLEENNINDAFSKIKVLIAKIEELSKSEDDKILYCSFASDFEKMIFENIFAQEKEVRDTPYENDIIYILYSEILLKKKRYQSAIEALDRAIYWNFLNREARSKKIDIYYSRKEIVKCLDAIKKLQSISYTAKDIATCYNKYAYVFDSLKDSKSAYALYRLSYSYFQDENVNVVLNKYEEENPEFKNMSYDEIINTAIDNEVDVNPNSKIIDACRSITNKLIDDGKVEQALIMLENDYSMTGDEDIAKLYNELSGNNQDEVEDKEVVEEAEEEKPEKTKKVNV